MRRRARILVGGALVGGVVVLSGLPASAHPLGNFTVNLYSGLAVEPERVVIDAIVDMAELPTFQARRGIDADGDGTVGSAEAAAYAKRSCPELVSALELSIDERPMPIRVRSSSVTFPPGSAGLLTLRLSCGLAADTGRQRAEHRLTFRNANYGDRVGWREITAVGDGMTLTSSDVATTSTSDRLQRYPEDLLQSPLDQRTATIEVRPGGPSTSGDPGTALDGPFTAVPGGIDRATRAFTDLAARRDLSLAFGLATLGLAILLGAVHAVAPGHGKTVMAAYLVGQRGSVRQAALIGATVTATHTAGVLALGLLISISTSVAPESLYPWLGLASGGLFAAVGVSFLRQALRRRPSPDAVIGAPVPVANDHGHPHRHVHDHGDLETASSASVGVLSPPETATLLVEDGQHGHGHSHPELDREMGWRNLVTMGLAGGLVPSPSALVVLLGATALGRTWFGVTMVVAYGLGMAATLTAAGLVLVRLRHVLDRGVLARRRTGGRRVARALPVLTAILIIAGGCLVAVRAAGQL